ncbi:MAG: tetratricopeptide repeat protein [Gemmatimonadota bacterium]|nr:tetratricopeptide repeat protein [Gemmatimonadota bacterium]
MTTRARRQAVSLVVILGPALGACVATRGDVRLLQDEMRALRSSVAASDTARRAQADSVLLSVARANDSLRALSARVSRVQATQADATGTLYELGRQLITIQELSGQSQRRLQELRASLENRAQEAASTVQDTAATTAPSLPGPNSLFEMARNNLARGSPRAARDALDTLIVRYPTADVVPAAQFFVAEAYAQEGNRTAADSVYTMVATRYPRSDRAPTALYKVALARRDAGQRAAAQTLLERIVREYPRTDEAVFAREQLRVMRLLNR